MTDPRTPDLDPRLAERIARLPEEVEPTRDLWPGIRAALETDRVQPFPGGHTAPRRRKLPAWLPLTAAAAALVVMTATVTRTFMSSGPGPTPAADLPLTNGLAAYERSADELATMLDRRAARLDPATRAVLERSLLTIDAAIDEARAALARDPSNAAGRAFVEAAYRQKIDFLRRANEVADLWRI